MKIGGLEYLHQLNQETYEGQIMNFTEINSVAWMNCENKPQY